MNETPIEVLLELAGWKRMHKTGNAIWASPKPDEHTSRILINEYGPTNPTYGVGWGTYTGLSFSNYDYALEFAQKLYQLILEYGDG